MIAKIHRSGSSFRKAVAYCLGDKKVEKPRYDDEEQEWTRKREERRQHLETKPSFALGEISERVEWTETMNLDTDDPRLAARLMAATASYSEELKHLAGIPAGGRKLQKPVCHYTLYWKKGEMPKKSTMVEASKDSLRTLHMEEHQALLVAHRDENHALVHVIVNRVSLEDGRAAKLNQSRLHLSRWAERYERGRDKGETVYNRARPCSFNLP